MESAVYLGPMSLFEALVRLNAAGQSYLLLSLPRDYFEIDQSCYAEYCNSESFCSVYGNLHSSPPLPLLQLTDLVAHSSE